MAEKRLAHIEDIIAMLQEEMPTPTCGRDVQGGYAYAIGMVRAYAREHRGNWVRANMLRTTNDGKWKPSTNTTICSACHSEAYWSKEWGTHLFKFCPFCGARMNKEE